MLLVLSQHKNPIFLGPLVLKNMDIVKEVRHLDILRKNLKRRIRMLDPDEAEYYFVKDMAHGREVMILPNLKCCTDEDPMLSMMKNFLQPGSSRKDCG